MKTLKFNDDLSPTMVACLEELKRAVRMFRPIPDTLKIPDNLDPRLVELLDELERFARRREAEWR